MIRPDTATLARILALYGLAPDDIAFLGGGREDSDGVVYTYDRAGEKRTLKIVSLNAGDDVSLDRTRQKLAFARHLGENGVRVACPVEEPLFTDSDAARYMSCTMRYVEGAVPERAALTPGLYRQWGRLTGRSHALAGRYPVWKNLSHGRAEYAYLDEMHMFAHMAHDEYIKDCWRRLEKELAALSVTRDTFGFTQNDNHVMNMIWDGDSLTQIDFDVATCHFFAGDLVTMLQNYFFEECGGFMGPPGDNAPVLRALDAFLDGYAAEHALPGDWRAAFELLTQYRRLLLFTVMQDWLATQPELREGFLRNIADRPDMLRGFGG